MTYTKGTIQKDLTHKVDNEDTSYKRDFVIPNKSVINYLPRCTYHLLYWEGMKSEKY